MIKETKHIKSCQLSQTSLTNRIPLLNFTFSDHTLHSTLCNKDQHFTWNLDFKISICFWPILKAFLLLLTHYLCSLHIPRCSTFSQLCWSHRDTRNSACISLAMPLHWQPWRRNQVVKFLQESRSKCPLTSQCWEHWAAFQALAFHPHYLFIWFLLLPPQFYSKTHFFINWKVTEWREMKDEQK